jgi:hypothetical protein
MWEEVEGMQSLIMYQDSLFFVFIRSSSLRCMHGHGT